MGRSSRASTNPGLARLGAFGVAAVILLAAFATPVSAARIPAVRAASPPESSSLVRDVVVTWNGKNVSPANDPSNELSISKGQTALVVFTFFVGGASDVPNVSLSMTYLGIVLTTSRAATHVVGGPPIAVVAEINWSFGPLYDALEGDFEFTASLLGENGAPVWNDSFYVFAKAPYYLESAAVIVLLVLTVAELYWGIGAIRDARKGARPPASESKGAPGSAPPSGSAAGAPPSGGAGEAGAGPPTGSGGSP